MERVSVFNNGLGFVRLVDYVGDELSIVNAARVSFHQEQKEMTDRDKGLIDFLLKNKHGSPFEQGFMSQWHIRLPIFVMREWVRHRIGFSINEESGRYVEMRPDFYIPSHIRTQKGKPGSYTYEIMEDKKAEKDCIDQLKYNSEYCYEVYKVLLDNGAAKEQARLALPLNLYTEIRWTCNARSLMNFLALRNDSNAMFEIAAYARAIEIIFAKYMPNVYKSFVAHGRIAP